MQWDRVIKTVSEMRQVCWPLEIEMLRILSNAVVLTHSIAPIKKPAEAGLIIGTTEWINPNNLRVICPPSGLRLRLVVNCFAVKRSL